VVRRSVTHFVEVAVVMVASIVSSVISLVQRSGGVGGPGAARGR
jgi:hypothetical protein